MKGYTTILQIENYLLIDVIDGFEYQINDWIAMMENYIDDKTGRNFKADGTSSIRKYDGDKKYLLFIDDCVEIEEVKVDDSAITDYKKYPANKLPTTWLKRKNNVFSEGNQNIEVKAKWGYSVEPPDDIVFAATVLVAGIINFSLSAEGEVKSEKVGDYSVTYKDKKEVTDFDRAKEILNRYQKINL